jgi:molybdopterin-containing oxidoreductase family iron-sulfur binding subunit
MRYGMLIDLNICAGCGACVMACKQANGTPQNIYWQNIKYIEEGKYPNAKKRVMPTACMHCENAPCVANCPSGASTKREDGIVVVDNEVCIGCQTCITVCPYSARSYVENDPNQSPYWGESFELTPYEEAKTTKQHKVATVGKCIFCASRLDKDKEPLCVQTCISKCRVFGDLDDANSEINKAIKELKAEPYREELETGPSVYYVNAF